MIDNSTVEFFNNRLTYNFNDLKNLTPSQKDQVRHYGSLAENLLKNRDFVLFVRQFQLENTRGFRSFGQFLQSCLSENNGLQLQCAMVYQMDMAEVCL